MTKEQVLSEAKAVNSACGVEWAKRLAELGQRFDGSGRIYPDVKSVRYLQNYEVELLFADGVSGRLDLAPWIVGKGGVFTPLEDPGYFSRVSVNADIGTIVWPNDVDFDPEVLYGLVTNQSVTASPPLTTSNL